MNNQNNEILTGRIRAPIQATQQQLQVMQDQHMISREKTDRAQFSDRIEPKIYSKREKSRLPDDVIDRFWIFMGKNYTTWATKFKDHHEAKLHWATELGDLGAAEIAHGCDRLKLHASDFAPELWHFKAMCMTYHDDIVDKIYQACIIWYTDTLTDNHRTKEALYIMQNIDYSSFIVMNEAQGKKKVKELYNKMREFIKGGGVLMDVPPRNQKKIEQEYVVNESIANDAMNQLRQILGIRKNEAMG